MLPDLIDNSELAIQFMMLAWCNSQPVSKSKTGIGVDDSKFIVKLPQLGLVKDSNRAPSTLSMGIGGITIQLKLMAAFMLFDSN